MIKLLADIYSKYGSIVAYSSEDSANGFLADNLLDDLPIGWHSDIAISHYIVGSLAFKGDTTQSLCPINAIAILGHDIPNDASIFLELYASLDSSPLYTITLPNTGIKMDLSYTSALYYKIVINLSTPASITIGNILVGQAWSPNRDVDAKTQEIKYSSNSTRYTLRNGSTFAPPTQFYQVRKITINELLPVDTYSLLDIFARYGKSTPVFITGLQNTMLENVYTIYGRLSSWSPIKPSVSGNYTAEFTVEEALC